MKDTIKIILISVSVLVLYAVALFMLAMYYECYKIKKDGPKIIKEVNVSN